MSRSSQLELHAADFQVLTPPDLVSLPSEPPDIGNWFSSYIYESPELNTLDGFQDCDGSGETYLEEEDKGKSRENESINEPDHGLPAAVKVSSDGVFMGNESDYSESAAVVIGSSESLSLSSEPPDIKNWFSSYLYESTQLDATHDFTLSDYECEDNRICNAQRSCRQDKKDVMNIIDDEKHRDLSSQSRISDVVVKCINLVKDSKLDHQTVGKDGRYVYLKPTPSTMCQLTSGKVYEQLFPRQRTGNITHGSVKKSGNINTYDKSYDVMLGCSFIERTSPEVLNMENNTGNQDGRTVHIHKSIGRKDHVHDSLENEGLHEIVSPGTVDTTVPKADSWRRPIDRRSTGKENEETESGFISTGRKNSRENTGKIKRHEQVEFGSFRNGATPALNRAKKVVHVSRKVLSEMSNLHFPDALESPGKWRCPQRNKPNRRLLKQLRLEQWIRRV